MPELSQFKSLLPEIFLALAGMTLLIWGVFSQERVSRTLGRGVVLVLLIAAVAQMIYGGQGGVIMAGLVIDDDYAAFMKILVLLASALTLILYFDHQDRARGEMIEYPILVLFATLGMMVMVSANDLLTVYIGIELQGLSLCVLAALERNNQKATEAGLKYFILAALSSGILLYGISLVYGFTGSTNFTVLADRITTSGAGEDLGLIFGLVLVMAGLGFKVSAAPFHMWTPDVYEGAPTPVTSFFAAAPKIAAMALIVRVAVGPFGALSPDWTQIMTAFAILSMLVGSFAALGQTNIKRLMAYSSIGHMGFALLGLAAGSHEGVAAVILYMTVYLFTIIGVFAIILCMRRRGQTVENIDDLSGLSQSHSALAAVTAILMFSMAGIPPLAGFFAKLGVLMAAIDAHLYTPAVIAVLTSVVSAYYYLRLIKLAYFNDLRQAFDRVMSRDMSIVLGSSAAFVLLFFAYPAPVLNSASQAAQSLFADTSRVEVSGRD